MALPPRPSPRPVASPAAHGSAPTEVGEEEEGTSPSPDRGRSQTATWSDASLDLPAPARADDARASASSARASPPTEMEEAPSPIPSVLRLPDRYADRGLLGMGGMGEVRRVYDRVLDRTVAMKLVRADRAGLAHVRQHFTAEARATARLAYPGIVPVYDQGTTPDGRLWFTMQEIRGETLSEEIARIHAGAPARPGPPPPGFRRLVDLLERAARAVAYAHAQGVVHRDLKPSNLAIGEHGEVMVVDWGLVRPAGVERGRVQGTPVYMSPEQARGGVVDARSDVYALGVVLWEICAGYHPFPGAETTTVIEALQHGRVPGPPPAPWTIPDELAELLTIATHPDPALRPADGGAFADALHAWLDGESRRERARAHIQAASELETAILALTEAERTARARYEALVAGNAPWDPDTSREAAWAAEDEANALLRRVAAANREVEAELEVALFHDPEAVDAHARLARRVRASMAQAEAEGRVDQAAELELRLRRHVGALPVEHPERERALAWLQGDGTVTLVTDTPARVELFRYVTVRRRLVPEHVRTLGETPLRQLRLPRGSWLLELHAPGCSAVRYPVNLDRETRWDGVAPGDVVPTPIHVPTVGEVGGDEAYVPAGWAELGGDPRAPAGLPALRVWVDGFVMRRLPVTHGEYVAFLDDLVRRGEGALAERYAPRDRGTTPGTWGVHLYGRRSDGTFEFVTDADGDLIQADWPVMYIDHVAAWTFARWEAARTGLPWRLPDELEWEKAARGVDRRIFPWGDFADPTWCSNRLAFPGGGVRFEPVGTRPTDESPYGIRDMAGGVLEWSATRMSVGGQTPTGGRVRVTDGSSDGEDAWLGRTATWRVSARGGSLMHDLNASRVGFRLPADPWIHSANLGFRLARSLG